MSEQRQLRIGDIVARTGLSERMIRHYEQLGLVSPDRSASGQRLYDADAMLALATVSLLKRAGLSLDQISEWLANPLDAHGLIAAQLDFLVAESDRIAASVALLKDLRDSLPTDGTASVDDLARIIESSSDPRTEQRARAFFERHFSPRQHNDWRDMVARLRQEVDFDSYDDAWRALIAEIKSALPLEPGSDAAQTFLKRWDDLLAPFRRVATEGQQAAAKTMWSNVGEWGAHARQPATQDVIDFITAAYAARESNGQENEG
ncbi:MAG: MerR family transcriptional regulator [Pseudomonadota bacterium]